MGAGDNKTLPEVVRLFITRARDKYGLGRFMPDELPLLNEMARLCAVESPVTSDVPKGTTDSLTARLAAAETRVVTLEEALRQIASGYKDATTAWTEPYFRASRRHMMLLARAVLASSVKQEKEGL